jgi:hypothetical protein
MLIEAVPVRLVTVPEVGVPKAPPLTTNAPAVPVLTPRAVTTPVPVVMVDGAAPAPPPTTMALDANALDEAKVPLAVKAKTPPEVPEVRPVPPLATAKVPARVIVPLPVTGPPEVVRPVVPPDTSTLVTVPVY